MKINLSESNINFDSAKLILKDALADFIRARHCSVYGDGSDDFVATTAYVVRRYSKEHFSSKWRNDKIKEICKRVQEARTMLRVISDAEE